MSDQNRIRSVCFTLNNWTAEDIAHIGISASSLKYIVYQQEIAPTTGTPHLQGYASAENGKTFAVWKQLLCVGGTRVHVIRANGSAAQNKEYCTKDSDRVPGSLIFERGAIPTPGQRVDLDAFAEACKDLKRPISDLADEHPGMFIKHFKGVAALRVAVDTEARRWKTEVHWFFGSTGTGKTRLCHELAPSAYWKQGGTKWWCGYLPNEHTDIIIDEYRPSLCPFNQLLSLFDRYPLVVESKGGNLPFKPQRIFVTSPKCPEETWQGRTEEDLQQLLRRLTTIVEIAPGGIRRYIRGTEGHFSFTGVRPQHGEARDGSDDP